MLCEVDGETLQLEGECAVREEVLVGCRDGCVCVKEVLSREKDLDVAWCLWEISGLLLGSCSWC